MTDAFGFSTTRYRTIIVADTTKPTISIYITDPTKAKIDPATGNIRYQIGTTFADNVIVRTIDNYDPPGTPNRSGSINPNVMGYYTITYRATDASGNVATPLTVVIKIDDLIAPVVTLKGTLDITVDVDASKSFSDPGVTATDNYYPVNTLTTTVTPATVRMDILNNVTLVYNVCDPSQNCSSVSRVVHVVDRIAPVIHITGDNPYELLRFAGFTDPGVYITDNYYTDATLHSFISVQNNVTSDIPGYYYVTYNVCDPSSNCAVSKQRLVHVIDHTDGVTTITRSENYKLYPNPSNGKFVIELNSENEIQTIRIYSVIGALIKTISVNASDKLINVDLSTTSDGIYIVKMEGNGKSFTQKINVVK
ncbi:MAG: immunoglobulin-like domain-containing protein [Bacteroidia bacterium]